MKQLQVFPEYWADDEYFIRLQPVGEPMLDHKPVRGWHKARAHVYDSRAKLIQRGSFSRPTLYSKCAAVIRPTDEGVEELYPRTAGATKPYDLIAMAHYGVEALQDHIDRSWDSDKKHLVMFSSGYDSRLLAVLLSECCLANTRFVCFQPEIEYAKAIYNYLSLPQECWFPIDQDKPARDYYADCLDFATIGRNMSECERFWGGALLTQLRLGDWLDDNVQGLSALFADETLKWNRLQEGTIARWLGIYHFDNPGIMPGRGDIDFIMPFVSQEWLRLLTEYRVPCSIDDFKLAMLRVIDPKLAEFPNWRFQAKAERKRHGGHLATQNLSHETVAKMSNDYHSSWYARETGIKLQFSNAFQYWSEAGSHYIKAAIFEHHNG
jgi:hypothetical protein